MKIEIKNEQIGFKPFTLQITIESQNDVDWFEAEIEDFRKSKPFDDSTPFERIYTAIRNHLDKCTTE